MTETKKRLRTYGEDKETKAIDPTDPKVGGFGGMTTIPELSPEELEVAYRKNALIRKGVNKRARDMLKAGFRIRLDSEDDDAEREANREAKRWMRSVKFDKKVLKALREMYVFGDGFIEKSWGEEDFDPMDAPPEGAPVALYNVDPYAVLPIPDANGETWVYLTGKNVRRLGENEVKRWVEGEDELPEGVVPVHPERIEHFQTLTLRDHPFNLGLSVIEAAYIAAISKAMGDRGLGQVLSWYSRGFFVVQSEGANPEELDDILEELKKAILEGRNYFASSEATEFDIKSPNLANVRPYYEIFYVEFAAALEMPTLLLMGVQKGTVTGSSVDIIEYYDDVNAFQRESLDPLLYAVFIPLLGRDDFEVRYNPLYVDKQTEANIRFKDSQAATGLFGGGVLTKRQAVVYMRTGDLPMPDEVPDEYVEKPAPTKRSDDPGAGEPTDGKPAPDTPDTESENDSDEWFGDDQPSNLDLALIRERRIAQEVMEDGGA